MDLSDWLTFWMTGSATRSSCTVTCKWTYLAHEAKWDEDYFRAIGLGALADEGFARIGTDIKSPGSVVGTLNETAALAMGLPAGIPVAAGLIDAHAGGIGTLGAPEGKGDAASRMAYVFGTSACTMSSHKSRVHVPGVWGPYFNAMLPDHWLNEGGQSAAGAALNQLIRMHPAYSGLRQILEAQSAVGLNTEAIVISGGAGANAVAQQILSYVTGLDILVPQTGEPVLLGAAMLGAVASGAKPNLPSAMAQMSGIRSSISHSGQSPDVIDGIYRRYIALQKAAAL